jgi:hypothetical protein
MTGELNTDVAGTASMMAWWRDRRGQSQQHWFAQGCLAQSTFVADFAEQLERRMLALAADADGDTGRARLEGAADAYRTILRLLGRTGA